MHLTNNWVTERSSQYLTHFVKLTNIQPRNNNIKEKKKHIKNEKKKNQKYIYTNTNNQSNI